MPGDIYKNVLAGLFAIANKSWNQLVKVNNGLYTHIFYICVYTVYMYAVFMVYSNKNELSLLKLTTLNRKNEVNQKEAS